mgnify:CR=1 FL=1
MRGDVGTVAAHAEALREFEEYARLNRKIPKESLLSILNIDDPGVLSDQIAAHTGLTPLRIERDEDGDHVGRLGSEFIEACRDHLKLGRADVGAISETGKHQAPFTGGGVQGRGLAGDAQLEGLLASIAQSAKDMVPWVYDFDVHLPDGERRRVHGASPTGVSKTCSAGYGTLRKRNV